MEITKEQISEAYRQAKRVFANEITLTEAKESVSETTNINESSAQGYINTFLKMMEGVGYTWTINAFGTDYFLDNIHRDYGTEALLTAIASLKKHLEYYEGVGKSSQRQINGILNKHIEKIGSIATFEKIQRNFNKQVALSLADSGETRKSRLKAARKKPSEIEVKVKIYSRNPDVVAEVLMRASGVCKKCGKPAPFNRAKDNSPFLEVHHTIQLAHGGYDTVDNAMALCPNCHRELHHGNKEQ